MSGSGLTTAVAAGQTMAPATTSPLMMHTVMAKVPLGV